MKQKVFILDPRSDYGSQCPDRLQELLDEGWVVSFANEEQVSNTGGQTSTYTITGKIIYILEK